MHRRHSFGGRFMDRYLIDYDPELDGAGADDLGGVTDDGAAAAAAADPPVDPVDPAVADPEPAAAAAPAWDEERVAGAVRDAMMGFLADQQPAEQPPGFDWDGLDPFGENFGTQLQQALAETVQQALAPIMPTIEQAGHREVFEAATGEMGRLQVPDDDRDYVLNVAAGVEAAAASAGQGVTVPAAIGQAWEQIRARDERIGQAAVERYKADLAAKAGAPSELSTAGSGLTVEPAAASLTEAARRFAERRNLSAA